jgi:hypothetical protein
MSLRCLHGEYDQCESYLFFVIVGLISLISAIKISMTILLIFISLLHKLALINAIWMNEEKILAPNSDLTSVYD